MNASESMQFQFALAALQRIARKRAGFTHKDENEWPFETCNCPQCIAKDALEQMYEEKAKEKP